jgi:hypothetical protein
MTWFAFGRYSFSFCIFTSNENALCRFISLSLSLSRICLSNHYLFIFLCKTRQDFVLAAKLERHLKGEVCWLVRPDALCFFRLTSTPSKNLFWTCTSSHKFHAYCSPAAQLRCLCCCGSAVPDNSRPAGKQLDDRCWQSRCHCARFPSSSMCTSPEKMSSFRVAFTRVLTWGVRAAEEVWAWERRKQSINRSIDREDLFERAWELLEWQVLLLTILVLLSDSRWYGVNFAVFLENLLSQFHVFSLSEPCLYCWDGQHTFLTVSNAHCNVFTHQPSVR